MSQQIPVERNIIFRGKASHGTNVTGMLNPSKIFREYNFTELAEDTTNWYTEYLDTTSTIALGSGGLILTTAATDTKTCTHSEGGIWWYPSTNIAVEHRFKIDVITNVAIFAGFSDAVSEASGLLPHAISAATQTATATNSAGLLFDTLQTAAYFNVVTSKTAGSTKTFTQLASTYVPVAATNLTLRTEIDSSGNAAFFWNGEQVGYQALAVTTTTPLIPFFGIRNNSGTAHVATLRYVRVWGDA
jgi:hypothetical protein